MVFTKHEDFQRLPVTVKDEEVVGSLAGLVLGQPGNVLQVVIEALINGGLVKAGDPLFASRYQFFVASASLPSAAP